LRRSQYAMARTSQGPDLSLAKLRSLVDWRARGYEADASAPYWLSSLSEIAAGAVGPLAILGPSGLSVRQSDGRPVRPSFDPAAIYLVGLAERVTRSSLTTAVAIPPDARHLPLIIAAAMVLGQTVAGPSGSDESRRRTLLVSPDLDLRSRYSMLAVDKVSLDAAHTGSRMRPDGSVVRLHGDERVPSGGVCFYLPRLGLPNRISFRPELIILDLRYGRLSRRAQEMGKWAKSIGGRCGILALYSLGDFETQTALSKAGYLQFIFDHRAIAACDRETKPSPNSASDLQIDWDLKEAPTFLRRTHDIVEIPMPDPMRTRFQQLRSLIDEHSGLDTPDLRRARWLLSTLRQLPVPMAWYEQAARNEGRSTIHRMIDHLGAQASRGGESLGPVIQSMRMQFDDLYNDIANYNPRALPLYGELVRKASASTEGRQVLLLQDSVMQHAFEQWMTLEQSSNQPVPPNVSVTNCAASEYLSGLVPTGVLINGPLKARYRWLLGSPLAPEVTFACYREEIGTIEAHLANFYDVSTPSHNCETRNTFMARLRGVPAPKMSGTEPATPDLILLRPTKSKDVPVEPSKERMRTVPGGLGGLGDFFKQLKEEEQRPTPPPATPWDDDSEDDDTALEDLGDAPIAASPDDVECLPVRVNARWLGACRLFLATDAPVEFIRPPKADLIKKLFPVELEPGDVLLRVEDGKRAGLFDRIVELAEHQARYSHLAAFRTRWRAACRQLAERYSDGQNVDYAALLKDLRANGAPITSELAVRWWIRELVIGPEKATSIAAVGKLLADPALVDQTRAFDSAFRQIRGLRQGLGRRLSTAIRRSFRHLEFAGAGESSDILEDQLGLPVDELVESLELAEVLEVGQAQLVPAHLIDRLLQRT